MMFEPGKEAPEYEAFEAALEIAERQTVAAMRRVSQTYQSERQIDPFDSDDEAPAAPKHY